MIAQSLYRMAYVSTASKQFSCTELINFLQPARKRNLLAGITGLLLYKGGQIMEVLEGLEENTNKAFARICQLPEHHGIILLIKEYMDQRQFTDWYMAFEMSPGLNIPGYSEFLNTSLTNDLLSFPLSRCTKLLHLLKVNIH
jgi:hypothetical protein